jgi:ectoine hydroxylase-related dioxygenase (phytanoyl-CoA dioxygenase family)
MMVIFPSWVSHAVEQNRSSQERVSLSMNATLVPKSEPAERFGGLGYTF